MAFFFSVFLPVFNRKVAKIFVRMGELYMPTGTFNDAAMNRIMLVANYSFDCLRFAYGRGILAKLSSYYVFFFVQSKDCMYTLW